MIKSYLTGGDREGFGGRDPLAGYSGGGGADGLAKALANNVTVEDCPDSSDSSYSALLFGKLVGAANISTADRALIKICMEIAYEDNVTFFNKGLAMAKENICAEAPKGGSHGGRIPNETEAREIAETKGMPWQEVVVVSAVLFSGTVPTLAEIELEGYGSDLGQWQSAKEMRKNGKPNMNTFVKSRDAAGYRSMISKGATRMAAHGSYSTGAAKVMLFVSKLSKMTFEQGMPGLFLDYCEEHCEMHKGQGLASGLNPLDTNVLTETVLAEKNKSRDDDEKLSKQAMQFEAQEQKYKNRMGEVSAMSAKISSLESQLRDFKLADKPTPARSNMPPSADNPCSYCKETDHFIRDCPKKAESDERKRKAKEASAKED